MAVSLLRVTDLQVYGFVKSFQKEYLTSLMNMETVGHAIWTKLDSLSIFLA